MASYQASRLRLTGLARSVRLTDSNRRDDCRQSPSYGMRPTIGRNELAIAPRLA
jgi:hypothetical protein